MDSYFDLLPKELNIIILELLIPDDKVDRNIIGLYNSGIKTLKNILNNNIFWFTLFKKLKLPILNPKLLRLECKERNKKNKKEILSMWVRELTCVSIVMKKYEEIITKNYFRIIIKVSKLDDLELFSDHLSQRDAMKLYTSFCYIINVVGGPGIKFILYKNKIDINTIEINNTSLNIIDINKLYTKLIPHILYYKLDSEIKYK